jgi:hypothetical protein
MIIWTRHGFDKLAGEATAAVACLVLVELLEERHVHLGAADAYAWGQYLDERFGEQWGLYGTSAAV